MRYHVTMIAYVVQWIRGGVDPVAEALVDAEGELIVGVLRQALPLQNELHYSRSSRRSEEIGGLGVKTINKR